MNPVTIVFDRTQEALFQEKILPLLPQRRIILCAFDHNHPPEIPDSDTILVWLGDHDLGSYLQDIHQSSWHLGILPHPDLIHGRAGLGVGAKPAEVIEALFIGKEPAKIDMLYCNERPVFNSVIVGDSFARAPGRQESMGLWARTKQFFRLMRALGTTSLKPLKLTTSKEKVLDTAALGVVAVSRSDASPLSRRVVDETTPNDGMLNALVLAPRSVIEAIRFLFASLLLRNHHKGSLPDFIGHIKTEALSIKSNKPVGYVVDGESRSAEEIHLAIRSGALLLLGMVKEPPPVVNGEKKEVFRVRGLPTGQARTALVTEVLPWIHHADTDEFKELFLTLRENAKASEAYLTLMVLSTLLAVLGLFANSAPVIIGAMILAPLMAPIISLAMGVLRQHSQLTLESAKALTYGIGLSLLCATLLTLITPLQTINPQIEARLSPTLLDLGVAIVSGIAGAYAYSRSEVAKSLAGVAIAVALVPPLAVAGIGIGWMSWTVFWGAWLLFLTNLVGIVLAAALTFMFLGFSPFARAKRGLVISLLIVSVVSVPLALSFMHMVDEHQVIRTLDGLERDDIRMQDVKIRSGVKLHISATLVADKPISIEQIDQFKQELESMLDRPIQLEAATAIIR